MEYQNLPHNAWVGRKGTRTHLLECYKAHIGKDPSLYDARQNMEDFGDLETLELLSSYKAMCKMNAEYERMEMILSQWHLDTKDNHHYNNSSPDKLVTKTTSKHEPEKKHRNNLAYTPNGLKDSDRVTLKWLHENYQPQEGVSVPRSLLYEHYMTFCYKEDISEPHSHACLGKLMKLAFPHIKSRRLGTRGKSKYHYDGISIKASSDFKDFMIGNQRINYEFSSPYGAFSRTMMVNKEDGVMAESPSHIPTDGELLLEAFPSTEGIRVPPLLRDKVCCLHSLYKQQAQKILDTIISGSLEEIKGHLFCFWQNVPRHMRVLMYDESVVAMTTLCDIVLYEAIDNLLIPSHIELIPDNLIRGIRSFSKQLVPWLKEALLGYPELLIQSKMKVARSFSECLYQQTSISHIASTVRSFLQNAEIASSLRRDWMLINVNAVAKECAAFFKQMDACSHKITRKYLTEFSSLLQLETSVETYINWLQSTFAKCVQRRLKQKRTESHKAAACEVMLNWGHVSRVIIRELTLKGANKLGVFHLLSLFLQEQQLYIIQSQTNSDYEGHLKSILYKDSGKNLSIDGTGQGSIASNNILDDTSKRQEKFHQVESSEDRLSLELTNLHLESENTACPNSTKS